MEYTWNVETIKSQSLHWLIWGEGHLYSCPGQCEYHQHNANIWAVPVPPSSPLRVLIGETSHFQVILSVINATDCFMWDGSHMTVPWVQSLHCRHFLAKTLRVEERDKHCQRHNGPEGWVHFSKVTYLVISQVQTQILIKLHLQNLSFRFEWNCSCAIWGIVIIRAA